MWDYKLRLMCLYTLLCNKSWVRPCTCICRQTFSTHPYFNMCGRPDRPCHYCEVRNPAENTCEGHIFTRKLSSTFSLRLALHLLRLVLRLALHLLRLVLRLAIIPLTSLLLISPRYNRHTDIYLPLRGSHLTIELAGSKHAAVICDVVSCKKIRRWLMFSFSKQLSIIDHKVKKGMTVSFLP